MKEFTYHDAATSRHMYYLYSFTLTITRVRLCLLSRSAFAYFLVAACSCNPEFRMTPKSSSRPRWRAPCFASLHRVRTAVTPCRPAEHHELGRRRPGPGAEVGREVDHHQEEARGRQAGGGECGQLPGSAAAARSCCSLKRRSGARARRFRWAGDRPWRSKRRSGMPFVHREAPPGPARHAPRHAMRFCSCLSLPVETVMSPEGKAASSWSLQLPITASGVRRGPGQISFKRILFPSSQQFSPVTDQEFLCLSRNVS